MAILVVAEHDNTELKPATLNTMTAARQIGGEVHVLVAGAHCHGVAEQAERLAGCATVVLVDSPLYQHPLAEPLSLLIAQLAKGYKFVLFPATTGGKNVAPRVAALLD